jgi:tetratricopeptide (TPR) repeat protein
VRPIPDTRIAVAGLVVLGLLPVIGRFASPTAAWGFHLTRYLASGAWLASAIGWGLLFLPPLQRCTEALVFERFGDALFGSGRRHVLPWLLGLLAVAGGAFWRLSTATHLLGDGVLLGEGVGDGTAFHATDGMDYLLHRLVGQVLTRAGVEGAAFGVYVWGSYLAGLLGVLTAVLLLRRTRLPANVRTLLLLLWLFSPASLLFCGYVESYGFLAVALLGFLWSGALLSRGEASPWLPGVFFGAALFLHSMALLALPGFLWLLLHPGPAHRGRPRPGLWVPALLLPAFAVLVHAALGYDTSRLTSDFLANPDRRSILVPLSGGHGLLSFAHWRDLANWVVLVIPVPAWLVLSRWGGLRRRLREPDIAFLGVHGLGVAVAFVLLDRKIGAARDWDLFAPHVAGLVWLAVRLWEPGLASAHRGRVWPSLRFATAWVALLLAWPWFAVNADRDASVRRFVDVRLGFAPYARAYASQDVAKHFRDAGDWTRAVAFYEDAVRAFPRGARFHALLAEGYLAQGREAEARGQRDEVLALTPGFYDEKARRAVLRRDYRTALELYRGIVRRTPDAHAAWGGLGFAAFKSGLLDEALAAFSRAGELGDVAEYDYYAGVVSASLGRWDEAVARFRRSLRGDEGHYCLGLAVALEGREAEKRRLGRSIDRARLLEAEEFAGRAARLSPRSRRIAVYREHIARVVAGREPPTADPPR